MMADRTKTTIRFPPELLEDLKKEAEKLGISVNALINIKLAEQNKKGGE